MTSIFEVPLGIDKIAVRKRLSNMLSEARKNAKPKECVLCGRPQTSFCNSHSVPQMALRSITENGMVLHASALMGFDEEIVDIEKGINKSGTFNYICNECDSTFFQDYENPETIVNRPTDKILAEIAVKDFLLQLSKRAVERELMLIEQRDFNAFENLEDGMEIKNLDFKEFESEVSFHKNIVDKNLNDNYHLLFWKVLPYTVPIAVQSAMALTKDMEGTEINDIYNMDPSIRMQYLHIAILPLAGKSVIASFYHKRDRAYRRLRHQFNSISEEEALRYLNYLVFKYAENYYASKKIEDEIKSNKKLQQLSQEYNENPSLGMLGFENNFGEGYAPVGIDEIPNFLSPEWSV